MATPVPRIRAPRTVPKGEIFEIKALITHQMETGLRRDGEGKLLPRKIVNAFTCRYNGEVVFKTELYEAVAANPYIEFHVCALESGTLEYIWEEDGGAVFTLQSSLTVT
jgi:sulfur-oxidizing protein SoxZ